MPADPAIFPRASLVRSGLAAAALASKAVAFSAGFVASPGTFPALGMSREEQHKLPILFLPALAPEGLFEC